MADEEHVTRLKKGVASWNAWRHENPDIRPDLSGADLEGANLNGAALRWANLALAKLSKADLSGADLQQVSLAGADLSEAKLIKANLGGLKGRLSEEGNVRGAFLRQAKLAGADLRQANLIRADLIDANLAGAILAGADLDGATLLNADVSRADLRGADLTHAVLADTNLTDADLTGCRVYGGAAWNLTLDGAKQQDLIITPEKEPNKITVDNIEVAQFIYLLLHNQKIRDVIDTIGKKGVLLLGRFTEGRMVVLERLRDKLRGLGFVPMVFNFDKPETKDFTETVRLLANLSHFVIVDITNPRSAPLELQATVPDYMVPFVPILQKGDEENPFAMLVDLKNKHDWVLQPVIRYPTVDRLIEVLEDEIVKPAEAKFNELLARRTAHLQVKNV